MSQPSSNLLIELFEREAHYQHFSGAVCIVRQGQPLLRFAAGYADSTLIEQLTTEHIFDIGSVSKQFTAAAILQLAHEKKIDLHAPINTYVGKWTSKRWKKVTIHHLLTHSSGIPSLFQSGQGLDDLWPSEQPISIDGLIEIFHGKKLLFRPGKKYRYSNSGYVLLAWIIEQVSDMSYAEYLKTSVFSPAGLFHTQFGAPSNMLAQPLTGYRDDRIQSAPAIHPSWAIGAGGIHSTVEDLAGWIDWIQSADFLNKSLRKQYLQPQVSKQGGSYAYGWEVIGRDSSRQIEHDGATFGYISYAGFRPISNDVVILLTNQTYPDLEMIDQSSIYIKSLAKKVWNNLDGEEIQLLPKPIRMDQWSGMEGTFEFDDGYQLSLQQTGDAMGLIAQGSYPPTRIGFHHPMEILSEKEERLKTVAEYSARRKYWNMASVFDKQMRFVIYSGLYSIGFKSITSGLGGIETAMPFEVDDRTGRFRLYGKDGAMDIIIYYNDENYIQGVFEDGQVPDVQEKQMLAYPVAKNRIWLDGFPYGEKSASLSLKEDQLIFEQFGRSFTAKRVKP